MSFFKLKLVKIYERLIEKMSLKVKTLGVIKIVSYKVFLFKKYNLQKSELYMKPALFNIFKMQKS